MTDRKIKLPIQEREERYRESLEDLWALVETLTPLCDGSLEKFTAFVNGARLDSTQRLRLILMVETYEEPDE